jgi:hypothetical protein
MQTVAQANTHQFLHDLLKLLLRTFTMCDSNIVIQISYFEVIKLYELYDVFELISAQDFRGHLIFDDHVPCCCGHDSAVVLNAR